MSKAVRLLSEKRVEDGCITDITVWLLPEPVPPCLHRFKYRLFFGRAGQRIVGYDNERGKGDHKHIGGAELPYAFVSIERLVVDFLDDVRRVKESAP